MTDDKAEEIDLSEEEYNERIQKYYELNLDEEDFMKNPSYFLLLKNYLKYRALNLSPPESLLIDLDKYLKMQLENEFSRRVKGGHQMTLSDFSYILFSKEKDLATKKKEYAKKHNTSLSGVEKRIKAVKKYLSSLPSARSKKISNEGSEMEKT